MAVQPFPPMKFVRAAVFRADRARTNMVVGHFASMFIV
jgi:hypothetical protein